MANRSVTPKRRPAYPRSFLLSRTAYKAKKCDFLLAPFPFSSLATRKTYWAADDR